MSTNKKDRNIKVISRVILYTMLLLTIYQILFVMLTSLKSTKEFYVNIWGFPKEIYWKNYFDAWVTAHIGQYFMTSTIVVSLTVIFIVIFGSLAGYALAKLDIPFAELIMFMIIVSLMFPSESTIMPLYIVMNKLHLANSYATLIIPYVGWGLPITIYIFKNFFATIPIEILESARVEGSGEIRTFTQIIMPLMKPVVATVCILNFVSWWGELIWANTSLSVSSQIRTLPMGILAFQSQFSTDWGSLSASMCIVLIPIIIFFVFVQKYFIEGITGGAVKA